MGEWVMSLYGVGQLLSARQLGPSQLLPAVDTFSKGVQEQRANVDRLLELLTECAGADELVGALSRLNSAAAEVTDAIASAFDGPSRLGARRRLQLERETQRLGAELEALRSLAEIVYAALHARPVELTLADVLEGQWSVAPLFPSAVVAVLVRPSPEVRFVGDPRVVRALLEGELREMGLASLGAFAEPAGERVALVLGGEPGAGGASQVIELPLAPALGAQREVLDALMAHARLGIERDRAGVRRLLV